MLHYSVSALVPFIAAGTRTKENKQCPPNKGSYIAGYLLP